MHINKSKRFTFHVSLFTTPSFFSKMQFDSECSVLNNTVIPPTKVLIFDPKTYKWNPYNDETLTPSDYFCVNPDETRSCFSNVEFYMIFSNFVLVMTKDANVMKIPKDLNSGFILWLRHHCFQHLRKCQHPTLIEDVERCVQMGEKTYKLDEFCQMLKDGQFDKIYNVDVLTPFQLYNSIKEFALCSFERTGSGIVVTAGEKTFNIEDFDDKFMQLHPKFLGICPQFHCIVLNSSSEFYFDCTQYKSLSTFSGGAQELVNREVAPFRRMFKFEDCHVFRNLFQKNQWYVNIDNDPEDLVCAVSVTVAEKIRAATSLQDSLLKLLIEFGATKFSQHSQHLTVYDNENEFITFPKTFISIKTLKHRLGKTFVEKDPSE